MGVKQIKDFDNKAALADTDEFVLQETAGGPVKKTTYSSVKAQKVSGEGSGEEILLKSPNGTVRKIRVTNEGVLTTQT